MSLKISQLKLSHGVHPHPKKDGLYLYMVEQVTNSTLIKPGQLLDEDQVNQYCASKIWNVTIVRGKKE